MSETIATGFSLVQVTTKNTAPRYPYGKAECHDNENHEKHGAISAVLPDGTSYAWNLARYIWVGSKMLEFYEDTSFSRLNLNGISR